MDYSRLTGQQMRAVHFAHRAESVTAKTIRGLKGELRKVTSPANIIRDVIFAKVGLGACFEEWCKCEALCAVCHGAEETKVAHMS